MAVEVLELPLHSIPRSIEKATSLNRRQILRRIPHGPKFCFLDSMEFAIEGTTTVGIGRLAITPRHCRDHFSVIGGYREIFPKVFCEEAGAQTGLVLATHLHPALIGQVAVFTKETTCTTHAPALPGQQLEMRASLLTTFQELEESGIGEAQCFGRIGKAQIFTMQFGFAFMTKDNFNRMIDTYRRRATPKEDRKAAKQQTNGA